MEYRTWDKAEVSPSLLGYGCMRFPKNEDGSIDKVKSAELLDKAMQEGVTYYDTAYTYHNKESELFLGEYLQKYERESYYLATKLPVWLVETEKDVDRLFEEQLEKLQTDYIDFYLMHAMDGEEFEKTEKLHVFEKLLQYREEGRIRHIGFSFHDSYEVFEKILKAHPWDFVQIQYNYMDVNYQAGRRGCKLAGQMGIPVVIMEPVRGGALANLPEDITAHFKARNPEASTASWALRFLADHSEIKVILSGMGTMEQLEDNIKTLSNAGPLSEEERELFANIKKMIEDKQKSRCTACAYCMPCPFGVDIPKNFRFWNDESMYQDGNGKRRYNNLGEAKATFCKECGKCEEACPQHIAIREDLKRVAADLEA